MYENSLCFVLFQEGAEDFFKQLKSLRKNKFKKNEWIIYKDLYKIYVRFGWYYLKNSMKFCFVWANGGVDQKFQRQGFFKMLIHKLEVWCMEEKLDVILFQSKPNNHSLLTTVFLQVLNYVKVQI